ncbi:MAG: glycosyltransferase family 2 protein [Desulfobulbaceae bacterium]|nr:glycosyltransferase family 2 protein [Desulfobulbaceae bacterium]
MNSCQISVALISFNEENRILRTLESVSGLCSEIIIVDSGSTDNTIAIAESCGAKVFIEDWKGFAEQKNSALSKCTKDWVLFLDCDEVLTPELRFEIAGNICLRQDINGYFINRRSVYCGKIMEYAWQPDKKLRLVRRNSNPKWMGDFVHENLSIEGKTAVMQGEMLHYSYDSMKTHFHKTVEYARLSAENYFEKGRTVSFFNLIANPIFAFCNMYIRHGAFMDGKLGLVASFSSMMGTFLKYAMLYEKKISSKRKNH